MGKISVKFMLGTVIVVLLGISVLGWIMTRSLESEVRGRADQEVTDQVESMLTVLQTVDNLSSESVRSAMKVLLQEGERIGVPETGASTSLAGESVPDLRLGKASQVGNFALVDHLKQLAGCTATLFVKKGDQFVRVSTNVLKADGSRAIGTILDPAGKAFAAIQNGQPFYGVVDILGKPYMTGYEPMQNAAEADDRHLVCGLPFDRGRRSWPAHQQRQNSGPRICRAPPRRRTSDIQAATGV